ncbi:MAG: hypothetical protein EZS28_037226 [Streblomastix strix]|uniref:Uncharacterized protein n=1 Tax=Streblomastix strix TaxID=222440 RepID=A0A5J4U9I9_9EUKA|nr:MAG: hypothetical protein EZS28_037226 [Streblomastix strix]
MYDQNWYNSGDIVPDQVTPACYATPLSDDTATAGISTEYSRGDHVHSLNITTTIPPSDSASGSVGTTNYYARNDHSHPLNITTSIPPQDNVSGSVGTANYYARSDHSHPINVETNASNIPIVNGVGANGSSAFYARQDHVHPQQLTYDGNVTATKFIKTGGTSNDILLADGSTKQSIIKNNSIEFQVDTRITSLSSAWIIYFGNGIDRYGELWFRIDYFSYNTTDLPTGYSSLRISRSGAGCGLSSESGAANRGLHISADGNTLSFNGSVIAGVGATNEATNGSVQYSAGNPIQWVVNSTGTEGGFYSNGTNICWRARPVTLGSVPP